MNGYEKHSNDYGGPKPGWGTVIFAVALVAIPIGILIGSIILGPT
jgi:hypothetical protein